MNDLWSCHKNQNNVSGNVLYIYPCAALMRGSFPNLCISGLLIKIIFITTILGQLEARAPLLKLSEKDFLAMMPAVFIYFHERWLKTVLRHFLVLFSSYYTYGMAHMLNHWSTSCYHFKKVKHVLWLNILKIISFRQPDCCLRRIKMKCNHVPWQQYNLLKTPLGLAFSANNSKMSSLTLISYCRVIISMLR